MLSINPISSLKVSSNSKHDHSAKSAHKNKLPEPLCFDAISKKQATKMAPCYNDFLSMCGAYIG